jgi:hypothetical protein
MKRLREAMHFYGTSWHERIELNILYSFNSLGGSLSNAEHIRFNGIAGELIKDLPTVKRNPAPNCGVGAKFSFQSMGAPASACERAHFDSARVALGACNAITSG